MQQSADPAVPYKIVPPQHSLWGGKKGVRGKKILFVPGQRGWCLTDQFQYSHLKILRQ